LLSFFHTLELADAIANTEKNSSLVQ